MTSKYKITVAVSMGVDLKLRERLLRSVKMQRDAARIEIVLGRRSEQESIAAVRNRLFAQAQAPWVLFLDEDCELPDFDYIDRLLKIAEKSSGCVGGYYLGGRGIWGRTYNSLANFWLKLHADQMRALPVAGNFALKKIGASPADFPFGVSAPFGGEEVGVQKNLIAFGIEFSLHPELSVIHNTSKSARTFFARAWTHGLAPRVPVAAKVALRDLLRSFRGIRGLRVKTLMIAYLATVVTARLTWHLLPKSR